MTTTMISKAMGAKRAMAYAATAALIASGADVAQADFVGDYDPANWNFDPGASTNASVTNDGVTAVLTGSSDSIGALSTYTVAAIADGTVSFDWNYFSTDSGAYDLGGFIKNGGTQVFAFNSTQGSGNFSTNITAGDSFGFFVRSSDGMFGPGILSVDNFSVSAVPEPTSAALLAVGAMGVLARRRRKNV